MGATKQGFAGMDPAKQKEIARRGGRNAHLKGTAHQWTSAEAVAAGRKGGKSRARKLAEAEAEYIKRLDSGDRQHKQEDQ